MSRHHVHLSDNKKTAEDVGNRRGEVIILSIDTEKMVEDGFQFHQSKNKVWLVDSIPSKYIIQD